MTKIINPSNSIHKVFTAIGFITFILFLIGSFSGYMNPAIFRGVTFFAIGFPFLFLAFSSWCILAVLFFNRKWWIFLLLLPAYKNLFNSYPLRTNSGFTLAKEVNDIRILSWNVNEFLFSRPEEKSWKTDQKRMLDFIQETNPDILCFQDYIVSPGYAERDVTKFIKDSLGFPYLFFSMDDIDYGTIIFSKFPIQDSGRIKYNLKSHPESIAFVDLLIQSKKMRVFTTHFKSMFLHHNKLTKEMLGDLKYVKEDTSLLFHSNMFERLEYFDRIHALQAALVAKQFSSTKIPFVFCADLNSVPASYVYQSLRKKSNDAFLEKGGGIRGTYKSAKSLLRIDVILTSKDIKTKQFYSPQLDLSDHYPLVADIQLAK